MDIDYELNFIEYSTFWFNKYRNNRTLNLFGKLNRGGFKTLQKIL